MRNHPRSWPGGFNNLTAPYEYRLFRGSAGNHPAINSCELRSRYLQAASFCGSAYSDLAANRPYTTKHLELDYQVAQSGTFIDQKNGIQPASALIESSYLYNTSSLSNVK
jgi:hypothetical protein